MPKVKFFFVISGICFVITATQLTLCCIANEPEFLELQDPVPVPMVVESEEWCEDCLRQPVRKVLDRKTVRRVVLERPAVETFVQVTRERRVRRKPVRSFVRRLFCR